MLNFFYYGAILIILNCWEKAMFCDRIDLYQYFNIPRPKYAKGYLDLYVKNLDAQMNKKDPDLFIRKRPAMLIIPGGGYTHVSGREGEPVAVAYMELGFHAFVLDYSVAPVTYPAQLLEASMAMLYIRKNAKKFNIDTKHVCAVGFSAGGHLCGMLATMYGDKVVSDVLNVKADILRPDAVILSYPVISSGEYAHRGSFVSLSGGDSELADSLSLEFKVTKDTPPAFIWSTDEDSTVPCENSLLMALAYRKAGVPMELHVFEPGKHGLSTCGNEVYTTEPTVRAWVGLSKTWLKNRGFEVRGF